MQTRLKDYHPDATHTRVNTGRPITLKKRHSNTHHYTSMPALTHRVAIKINVICSRILDERLASVDLDQETIRATQQALKDELTQSKPPVELRSYFKTYPRNEVIDTCLSHIDFYISSNYKTYLTNDPAEANLTAHMDTIQDSRPVTPSISSYSGTLFSNSAIGNQISKVKDKPAEPADWIDDMIEEMEIKEKGGVYSMKWYTKK